MKRIFLFCCLFLLFYSSANANLTTIGTAQFGGEGNAYKLIWDDNNNGNSVVWLDYSNTPDDWSTQTSWAQGLNSPEAIVLSINPAYSVNWGSNAWRLPTLVGYDLEWNVNGSTSVGYNITTSEMGHLFYAELDNLGLYSTSSVYEPPGWGLTNTGDFDNLTTNRYWYDKKGLAPYSSNAFYFRTFTGEQGLGTVALDSSGLAVRSGQVSTVPVPGALWLLWSGLIGLVGLKRRK